MFFDVNSVLTTTILCLVTSLFIHRVYASEWVERRRYGVEDVQEVKKFMVLSSLYGVSASFVVNTVIQNSFMATAIGFLAFLVSLGGQFDIKSHLSPIELSLLTVYASALIGLVGLVSGQRTIWNVFGMDPLSASLKDLGVFVAIMVGVFIFCYMILPALKQPIPIGLSDLLVFFSAGLALSWYVGLIGMTMVFFIGQLITLTQFIWGRFIVKTISGKGQGVPALPAYSFAVVFAPLVIFM